MRISMARHESKGHESGGCHLLLRGRIKRCSYCCSCISVGRRGAVVSNVNGTTSC
jgi:hypothetical protein